MMDSPPWHYNEQKRGQPKGFKWQETPPRAAQDDICHSRLEQLYNKWFFSIITYRNETEFLKYGISKGVDAEYCNF